MKRSPLQRKTGLRRKVTLTLCRMREKKLKHLCMELFMARYRGQPCEVCKSFGKTTTSHTVGHHIISKGSCPRHRYSDDNIIVLCPQHHMFDRNLAAHSMNSLSVQRFLTWLETHKPEQFLWCRAHEHDYGRIDYQLLYEDLQKEAQCHS